MKAVECIGVSKHFQSTRAIDNLSFQIEPNTITGLVGRNGAGKTTLLKMIAGHHFPTEGKVHVFSMNPAKDINAVANLIMIDEKIEYPSDMTLLDILKEGKRFYKNWNDDLARRLVEYFKLPFSQLHFRLSKGKKSTFNAIVGLASRCPLTILDEPTSGMDHATRKDFYRAVLKDYIAHPRTIILSSHLINELEDLLENVLLIEDGQKVLHGSIEELKEEAIEVSGKKEEVLKNVSRDQLIYEKEQDEWMKIVIRRDDIEKDVEALRATGLNIQSVGIADLTAYLTSHVRGGIDDVFDQNHNR